jgi:ribosomal protein S12 methylthiotransferase
VKEDRWQRLMELQAEISADRLQAKVGREIDVIVDTVEDDGACARSSADAPEIDGIVHLREADGLNAGDIVRVRIESADNYDLWAVPVAR